MIGVPPVLAAGMIPAGMIGDRLGRKKSMLAALAIFGVSSLAAAYASSTGFFIAARAVFDLGAASARRSWARSCRPPTATRSQPKHARACSPAWP